MVVAVEGMDGDNRLHGVLPGSISSSAALQDRLSSQELPFFLPDISTLSLEPFDPNSPTLPHIRPQTNGIAQFEPVGCDVLQLEPELPGGHSRGRRTNCIPLPMEVWLRIFCFTAFASQRTLANVATLSSGFRSAAEEALYKHPEILNTRATQRLATAIRESPRRAGLVRGLRLGCSDIQSKGYISQINDILPALQRLHTLDFSGFGDVCVPEQVAVDLLKDTNKLKLPSLRRIRGLPLYLSPRLLTILQALISLEELPVHDYASLVDPDSDSEDTHKVVDIPKELPHLRVLSCPYALFKDVKHFGSVTSLCLSGVNRAKMDRVAGLLGPQLVSLRVERKLKKYKGMAYPTNWSWSQYQRLRFLDIRDIGRRLGDLDLNSETIEAGNLPASLDTLVWDPTWIMDCALVDSRSEEWRRNQIGVFAETILRRSGLKTVVYRWRKHASYQCVLVGGREEGQYREFLADPMWQNFEYTWVDECC